VLNFRITATSVDEALRGLKLEDEAEEAKTE